MDTTYSVENALTGFLTRDRQIQKHGKLVLKDGTCLTPAITHVEKDWRC